MKQASCTLFAHFLADVLEKSIVNIINMAEKLEVKELDQVVVRFSGDSGDGMQLAGNIFSTVMAFLRSPTTQPTSAPRKVRLLVCLVSRYT